MQRIRIPKANLEVSRIACGCMRLGGTWDDRPLDAAARRRAADLVAAACELGVTLFDHADIYTRGKAEAVFGEVLARDPSLRDRIVLQSKCGIRFEDEPVPGAPARYDFSRAHLVASVDASLKRLRTDRLDLLLLHRPDPLGRPEEVAAAFCDLEEAGKVRYFGVSNHTPAQIALLQRYVPQPLAVNQVELSLWHAALITSGVLFNTDAGDAMGGADGTLDFCRREDILVQAWSPVARGRAWATAGEGTASGAGAEVALIDRLAAERGVSREAIAIAWLLRHPANIQPVTGTSRPDRLRACCEADRVELSREEWYALLEAVRGASVP